MSQIASLYAKLGFKVNTKGLKEFEKRLNDTAKRVDRFGAGVRRSTEPVRKQIAGISALEKRYNRLGGTLSQVRQDYSRINQAYRAGDISIQRRTRLLNDINSRYRELRRSTDAATNSQRRYNRTPTNNRQGLRDRHRSALPSVAGAAAGGYAALRSSQAFQQYQGIESGLIAATGDREKAIEDFEYLVKLSKSLGTFIGDGAKSFTQLSAAARGSTLEGQGVRDIFTAVSSYSSVLNLSSDEVNRVYRGLTQTISKGQLYAEEVRGQIGEQLPGFIQALARATGNIKEDGNADVLALNKAMEKGQLQAEDVYPKLSEELMRMANAGGALEESMKNTSSAFGRFRTNVWLANKTLNESGFDKSIRDIVNQSSLAITRAEPLWEALGKGSEYLGDALEVPLELFGALAMQVPKVSSYVKDNATEFKLLSGWIVATVKPLRNLFLLYYGMASISDLLVDPDRDRSWQEWAVQLGLIAGLLYALKTPLLMVGRLFGGVLGTVTAISTATSRIRLPGAAGNPPTGNPPPSAARRAPGIAQGFAIWELFKLPLNTYKEFEQSKDESPKEWLERRASERGIDVNVTVDSVPFLDKFRGFLDKGSEAPLPNHSTEVLPFDVSGQLNDSNIENHFKPQLDLSFLEKLLDRAYEAPRLPTVLPSTRTENNYHVDSPVTIHVEGYNQDPEELSRTISWEFENHFTSLLRGASSSQQVTEK